MSFNKKYTDCPCNGCEDRAPGTGCHDTCKKFWKWRLNYLMRKQEDDRNNTNTMSDHLKHFIWRSRRYGRRVKHIKGTRNE